MVNRSSYVASAFVCCGSLGLQAASAQSVADLLCTSCDADMVAEGDNQSHLGYAVASGDWNGDGVDVIVAAKAHFLTGPSSDPSFGPMTVELYKYVQAVPEDTVPPTPFLKITNVMDKSPAGLSVAFVGDLDGGGREDLAIGAGYWDGAVDGSYSSTPGGRVLILIAENWPNWIQVQQLGGGPWTINASQVDIILQDTSQAHGRFGHSVAGGDVDGDGYSDLVVGMPGCDDSSGSCINFPGRAYLVRGGPCGLSSLTGSCPSSPVTLDLGTSSTAYDASIQGAAGHDRFGWSVAVLGDLNADGKREIAVGATQVVFRGQQMPIAPFIPVGSNAQGYITVWSPYGTSGTLKPPTSLPASAAMIAFGFSVAAVGDLDVDGVDDIVIGAPGYTVVNSQGDDDERGAAFLVSGSGAYAHNPAAATPFLANGTFLPNVATELSTGCRFGWAVSDTGVSFDGNASSDFLISAYAFGFATSTSDVCYGYSHGTEGIKAGRVFLMSGTGSSAAASAFPVIYRIGGEVGDPEDPPPTPDAGRLGYSLWAGSFDEDNWPDLLVSAFGLSDPDPSRPSLNETGRFYVQLGEKIHLDVGP